MSITRIENNQPSPPADHSKSGKQSARQAAGKKINSDKGAPAKIPEKRQPEIEKISDAAIAMISDYISQIKTRTETMVKFFPPFEAGNEERVRMLLNFAAFRRLIEKLTIPPSSPAEEVDMELKSIELKKTLQGANEALTQSQSKFMEYVKK